MSIPSLLVVSILLHLYIGTRIIPSLSGAVGATLFTLLLMASATLAPTGLLARPPRADTLAWNFFVKFQQPFTAGLHRAGRLRVYVSRGTGYWGPPKRFDAPSEITRVRLLTAELETAEPHFA
jgi:hypothetical protein